MANCTYSAIVAVAILSATGPAIAEDAAGDWLGQLPSGFKVRVHIDRAPDGLSGALINASGNRTRLDQIKSDGANLQFQIDNLGLSYDGAWNEDRKTWQGTLAFQGTYPLSFHRATAAEFTPKDQRRPQEDAISVGPRPYAERDVVFDNKSAKLSLAGTLTLPDGKGPFPAVILVCGTGPNMRDEDVAGHKVFLVLADALARQGIAVLRYDKRGVGQSTGQYSGSTTADFASDARTAIEFLKTQAGIDPKRVGVVGHSEGGIIAPMVGVDAPGIAFVVMLAGPSIRGDKLFLAQSETVSRLYGVPEDYIAKRKVFDRKLYDAVIAANSAEEASYRARAIVAEGVADKVVDANEAPTLARDTTTAWERYFLAYDPAPTLRRLTMPVLALYGSLDAQVPAADNFPVARDALKQNKYAMVVELPGLNHLLQKATTGSPQEYADIDETISALALKTITDWIIAQTVGP